jgi:hypothetical protein
VLEILFVFELVFELLFGLIVEDILLETVERFELIAKDTAEEMIDETIELEAELIELLGSLEITDEIELRFGTIKEILLEDSEMLELIADEGVLDSKLELVDVVELTMDEMTEATVEDTIELEAGAELIELLGLLEVCEVLELMADEIRLERELETEEAGCK